MSYSWQQQQLPFSTERGDDNAHESDNDDDLDMSSTMPADDRQHQNVTMRETIWNHIIGKSKALVLGQMLAFWLVRSFSVNSSHCELQYSYAIISLVQ